MGKITLVALPYDSGRFDERMGRGPLHLLESGLAEDLRAQHDVEVVTIRLAEGFQAEGAALPALQKLAAGAVRESLARDRGPIILSGNCGPAALSATCALGSKTIGVIWFDAHADFNTPETSASGFLDGMSLSILTGHCWPALAERFDGFEPVPEKNVLLIGARDLDSREAARLGESAITHILPTRMDQLERAVAELSERVANFYIHVDVDVLDESEGRANSYACGGGLSAPQLYAALEFLQRSGRMKVAGITAYDPGCDSEGHVRAVIANAARILAG